MHSLEALAGEVQDGATEGGTAPATRTGPGTAGEDSKETAENGGSGYSSDDERSKWAATVRATTNRKKHREWFPSLDPAAVLANVTVVMTSPKNPVSVGTVARACSAFECMDLRIVTPRCEHGYQTRSAFNSSKGAQYLVWNARAYDDLESCLADVDYSVAFTRWVKGRDNSFPDLDSLIAQPLVQELVNAPSARGLSPVDAAHMDPRGEGPARPTVPGPRIALVFGREVQGLFDEEVATCSASCAIPIGRLQESLSLSHAVTIALSHLFHKRLSLLSSTPGSGYGDESMDRVADGVVNNGVER